MRLASLLRTTAFSGSDYGGTARDMCRYADVQKLAVTSRNVVYTAMLDGKKCVLKVNPAPAPLPCARCPCAFTRAQPVGACLCPCPAQAYNLLDGSSRQRVERETLRLAKLRHRNIVRIEHTFVETRLVAVTATRVGESPPSMLRLTVLLARYNMIAASGSVVRRCHGTGVRRVLLS